MYAPLRDYWRNAAGGIFALFLLFLPGTVLQAVAQELTVAGSTTLQTALRLAAKHHGNAASVIITLTEH